MNTDFEINETLKGACFESLESLRKYEREGFAEIIGKLEYVIGSYDFDKNPVGLHEIGEKALTQMKNFKKENPKKLTIKTIEKLDKALRKYEEARRR